ncbi:MAG: ankyrin repeat domain-containing protein [Victivallales bacterium]|nr:ankyrin repeat domain-containing protein [Victivallales bacterium]
MEAIDDQRPQGYDYLQLCGRGRYGEAWLAREMPAGTLVALKLLRKEGEGEWLTELEGLRTYRAALGGMSEAERTHLIPILHCGENERFFYYTMEPADNLLPASDGYRPDTLSARLESSRMPKAEVVRVASELLEALTVLRRHGIVHRDIKPGNIFFFHGCARLGDIGLMATEASRLDILGSPGFVPPEMMDERAAALPTSGGEWDLYALGKVLYVMDTGMSAECFPLPNLTEQETMKVPALAALWSALAAEHRADRLLDLKVVERRLKEIEESLQPASRKRGGWRRGRKLAAGVSLLALLSLLALSLFTCRTHRHGNLEEAIVANDYQGVLDRLKKGDSPRAVFADGRKPLELALSFQGVDVRIVRELVARGAYTAPEATLELAIRQQQSLEIIQHLLLGTPRLDDLLMRPRCPLLHAAIDSRRTDVLRLLLDKSRFQPRDSEGNTPLMRAVFTGQKEATRMLLEAGAEVNALDRQGRNALFFLPTHADGLADVLLKAGGDVTVRAADGATVLLAAVRSRCRLTELKALCQAGVALNEADAQGVRPVTEAIALGERNVLEYLVEQGASVDYRTVRGFTPLHTAVLYDRRNLVSRLQELGCNLEACDAAGRTPLHWAALRNMRVMTRMLLEHGASPKAQDNLGLMPADLAAAAGSTRASAVLPMPEPGAAATVARATELLRRFSIQREPADNATRLQLAKLMLSPKLDATSVYKILDGAPDLNPRHPGDADFVRLAVDTGQITVLQHVLASMPNLDVPDLLGRTPLMAAVRAGHLDMAEMLCFLGADTTCTDQDGLDWLVLAYRAQQPRTAYFAAWTMAECFLDGPWKETGERAQAVRYAVQNTPARGSFETQRKLLGIFSGDDFLRWKFAKKNASAVARALDLSISTPNFQLMPGHVALTEQTTWPMLNTLLRHGALPGRFSFDGRTVLHRVLTEGKPAFFLRLLLDYGADPMLPDCSGKTAMDVAADYGLNAQELMRFYLGKSF